MSFWVTVVLDVPGLKRVDGMIASETAIFAGEPFRAALAEDDVSGDDVLFAGLFGAKASARGIFGVRVGGTLGCVRSVTKLGAEEGGVLRREGFWSRKGYPLIEVRWAV